MTDRIFSFPSSGDALDDAREASAIELREARLERNVCANCCAEMTWLDQYSRECPRCGFLCFSSTPYDIATAQA